jgi:hypothetical protein
MAREKPKKPNNKTIDLWARNMTKWGKWVAEDIAYIEEFLQKKYPGEFRPKAPPTKGVRARRSA